jgi:cell shape-determining protein MreC
MDKLTKGIFGITVTVTVIGVVCIMSLVMKLSDEKDKTAGLIGQINERNTTRQDDRVGAFEKQMKSASSDAANDLKAVKAERAQLSETIAKTIREKKEAEELTPLQKKIREAPAIGKVIAVKEGLGFVVINAGSSKGIEEGSRFNIRRDKFIVAEVEINEVVDADNSIGNIDSSKQPPGISIRKGDEVIGHPIF